jgi:hypothetical protein
MEDAGIFCGDRYFLTLYSRFLNVVDNKYYDMGYSRLHGSLYGDATQTMIAGAGLFVRSAHKEMIVVACLFYGTNRTHFGLRSSLDLFSRLNIEDHSESEREINMVERQSYCLSPFAPSSF